MRETKSEEVKLQRRGRIPVERINTKINNVLQ
jgi:hypothetical protein